MDRCALFLFCLLARAALADAEPMPTEHQVKAAFVLNFVRFVEWPETVLGAGQPIVIGVLGAEPFGQDLAELVRDRAVDGRTLLVRRTLAAGEARRCHVLFIGASEGDRIPRLLRELRGEPVLSVGETEGFTSAGGVIGFSLDQDDRVRFEVNLEAAGRATLRISSRLLRLARAVHGGAGGD